MTSIDFTTMEWGWVNSKVTLSAMMVQRKMKHDPITKEKSSRRRPSFPSLIIGGRVSL